MDFDYKSPGWINEGIEPSNEIKEKGWLPGYKPPAAFMNNFWYKVSKCIDELQAKLSGLDDSKVSDSDYTGTVIKKKLADAGIAVDSIPTAASAGQFFVSTGSKSFTWKTLDNVSGGSDNTLGADTHGTVLMGQGNNDYSNSNAIISGAYGKNTGNTSNAVILGNGTSDGSRSNCFRVTTAGRVYGMDVYSSSGADYAEMFEWVDGNPNDEDRRGLFVTLDGEKIRLANSADDYILGVVSGNPSVLGNNAADQWSGMYMRDVFGALIEDQSAANGLKLNPAYNPKKPYIPREDRKEWDAVGLVGKLVLVDDGTCVPNGYCAPADGGIATSVKHSQYRVMSRIDDKHIRVLIR